MNASDPRGKSSHYFKRMSVRFNKSKFEFLPTQFIIDERYTGNPPKVQVGFKNINDNIDEKFLRKEISKVGPIRQLEIVRHPNTGQHLGLAKVQFEDSKTATRCIESYNGHSLMGKRLDVFLDVRFAEIEATKQALLNPEPRVKIAPIQPALQNSNIVHPTISQLAFPTIQIPPPPSPQVQLETTRSNNRPHVTLSLDDRLAKLGLKQAGPFPPQASIQPQVYSMQDRNTSLQQYHHNHMQAKQEKKIEVQTPAQINYEEDEKAWNPQTPEPTQERIRLVTEQDFINALSYLEDKYLIELERNLFSTMRHKLTIIKGYPRIDAEQVRYKKEQDERDLERRKQEQENINKQREKLAMSQKRSADLEKQFVGRTNLGTEIRKGGEVIRHRTGGSNLIQGRQQASNLYRRINRSSAFVDETVDLRHKSIGSDDSYSRRSRSPRRSRLTSHSRSPSSGSSLSSRSSSSSSRSSSSSSSSRSRSSSSSSSSSLSSYSHSSRSSSSSRSACSDREKPLRQLKTGVVDAAVSNETTDDSEKVAAEALLAFHSQNHAAEKVSIPKVETAIKKRKKKVVEQENRSAKRIKHIDDDEEPSLPTDSVSKSVTFPPDRRSSETIKKMWSALNIDLEDIKYLELVHNEYENQNESNERARIPFGSRQANEAHVLINDNDIAKEMASGLHPKWWNGCSRTSLIEISDKGKMAEEEDAFTDLQKAPIKSHVIQAANSTRRDQRNDQRRIAALNPEIDPSFLKHVTSNTLQMRAKNLRFSRSKIHKWGLFACEKINNGDAVIEYVGEKIRPSVADHREKIVYTNLPTHDGSSYFFRVDTDVIDATLKGNKARFINHSCNPNCIAKVIKHENGSNSIVIYAKQTIEQDEEITYDYKFPREETNDKIMCRCKAANCQKYLN